MEKFDVIIIGSGIGGLISAGLLSSRGLKVLVLEKHSSAGGYLSSFKRKDFTFDSAVDCISGIGDGGLISSVLRMLGVEKSIEFVRVNPIRTSIFPDIKINVDADINVYIESLKKLFPSEKDNIENLFIKITEIYSAIEEKLDSLTNGTSNQFTQNSRAYQYAMMTYSELIEEFTKDRKLTAILSDRCPFTGLPASKVSALTLVALMMSYFRMGAFRPVGGHQRLSDALVNGIRNKGGAVIFNKAAEKIFLNGETCCGVRTADKDEYSGKFIISNADFIHTFRELLGDRYSFIVDERLKKSGISSSFFIVYAGIKGNLDAVGKSSSIGYFPSYNMESFFDAKIAFGDRSSLGLTIPTIEDRTLAPEGCHSVMFHEMTDFGFIEKWNEHKPKLIDRVLDKAEKLIPDIRKNIIHIEAATPLTLRRYTSNFKGSAYGWRQSPGNANPARHGINNLYIAGHWGEMGGGVLAAAYSGLKAAVEICRKEGIEI